MIKDREFLLIEAIESGNEILLPFQIIKEEKEYTPDFLIPRDKGIACFDADKLNGDIHYRKWQTGDTFIPFGMKGKKNKRLSDRPQIFYQSKRTPVGTLLWRTHCVADRRTNRQPLSY